MTQEPREHADDDRTESGPRMDVPDEQLPEDLQPSEDNPLALPADDDVPDDILTQGADRGASSTDSGGDSGDASAPGTGGVSDTSPSADASSETESDRAPAEEPEDSERG